MMSCYLKAQIQTPSRITHFALTQNYHRVKASLAEQTNFDNTIETVYVKI